ncbi:hypothetical protein [Methylobacter sp.]|uniref:hypothetical protein n=1 Tax=Methylobacter sp. TaxID=2051955 RepID=UPI002FDCF7B1
MSNSSPLSLPLYVFPLPDKGGFKIGIKISFDNTTFKMYEFDTGGSGFWAAGNSHWWSQFTPPNPNPGPQQINYSSGIQYTANPVITTLYFENPDIPPLSTTVAQITQATKNNNTGFEQLWQNAFNEADPQPPLWGNFFGDFGMGLSPFMDKSNNTGLLYAILPQLTDPLCNGFIIDLGPYPGNTEPNAEGWVQKGSIQIGLNTDDSQSFPSRFKMLVSPSNLKFPDSGMPTYSEKLVTATLELSPPNSNFSQAIDVVFDTGAPSIEIHVGAPTITTEALNPYLEQALNDNIKSSEVKGGIAFNLTAEDINAVSKTVVQVQKTGGDSGSNEASATQLNLNPPGYVNVGLVPFFNGQVLYDLRNGIIGFKPYS